MCVCGCDFSWERLFCNTLCNKLLFMQFDSLTRCESQAQTSSDKYTYSFLFNVVHCQKSYDALALMQKISEDDDKKYYYY